MPLIPWYCHCFLTDFYTWGHSWAAAHIQKVIIIKCTWLQKVSTWLVIPPEFERNLAIFFGPRLCMAWHATLHLRPSFVYLAFGLMGMVWVACAMPCHILTNADCLLKLVLQRDQAMHYWYWESFQGLGCHACWLRGLGILVCDQDHVSLIDQCWTTTCAVMLPATASWHYRFVQWNV